MGGFIVKVCLFILLDSVYGLSEQSSECDDIEYNILDDPNRNAETGEYADLCDVETTWTKAPDWHGPGWYRMKEPAGTVIPENVINVNKCGTYSPGWLNGTHPKNVGEVVNRRVCYNYEGHFEEPVDYKNDPQCYRHSDIKIKNCGDFYLYELPEPSDCPLRYCSISQ